LVGVGKSFALSQAARLEVAFPDPDTVSVTLSRRDYHREQIQHISGEQILAVVRADELVAAGILTDWDQGDCAAHFAAVRGPEAPIFRVDAEVYHAPTLASLLVAVVPGITRGASTIKYSEERLHLAVAVGLKDQIGYDEVVGMLELISAHKQPGAAEDMYLRSELWVDPDRSLFSRSVILACPLSRSPIHSISACALHGLPSGMSS